MKQVLHRISTQALERTLQLLFMKIEQINRIERHILISEQKGGLVVGTSWPYRQVAWSPTSAT